MQEMMPSDIDVSGVKIAVAFPCYDGNIPVKTAGALLQAAAALSQSGVGLTMLHQSGCSLVVKSRNAILSAFKNKTDCTHLIMVDNDIVFDPMDIVKLTAMGQLYDVVCGLYPVKKDKPEYFIQPVREESNTEMVWDERKTFIEAKRAPAGFMMVRDHVVNALFERWKDRPYTNSDGDTDYAIFDQGWTEEGYLGEDYMFCDRVRELGFKIYVDPSIKLTHVGRKEYEGDFLHHVVVPELQGYRTTPIAAE